MSTTGWIILIIVIIIIIALIGFLLNRRNIAQKSARAEELRTEARSQSADMHESDLQAREAAAEADRKRAEAERAEQQAQQARQGADVDQAQHEDRMREADRIDPNVDHEADDYQPGTSTAGTTGTTGTTGGGYPADDTGTASGEPGSGFEGEGEPRR